MLINLFQWIQRGNKHDFIDLKVHAPIKLILPGCFALLSYRNTNSCV
jgi:hypothetical protein